MSKMIDGRWHGSRNGLPLANRTTPTRFSERRGNMRREVSMPEIKLTFRWRDGEGEGVWSQADVNRLREMGGVAVLDFLNDVRSLSGQLYETALEERWLWKGCEDH